MRPRQGVRLDLQSLLPPGSSDADYVVACQEFYYDACLHGFATPITISSTDLSGCLKEIQSGNCNAVLDPQSAPGCVWIVPPDAGVDSGTTTDAVVAVVDTGRGGRRLDRRDRRRGRLRAQRLLRDVRLDVCGRHGLHLELRDELPVDVTAGARRPQRA